MNTTLLNKMIEEGYIHTKKHPTADLWIYNYTQAAQYNGVWNDATVQCRGLIMDENRTIVARPFRKFFNLSEVGIANLPDLPFEVYEKLDGSLGVLYWIDNRPYISTRGSFESEQALVANELLTTKYEAALQHLDVTKTYVFEIIYPENRIVVDYGKEQKLVLLGIIDTQTGAECELVDIGFPLPQKYTEFNNLEEITQLNWSNHEGFVLKFENNFRIKIKFEEYVGLHKIITQVSSYTIWEQLANNKSLMDYIELVPDEFYSWVRKIETQLTTAYQKIETTAKAEFKVFETDKETALYFQTCTYPAVLFAMWKNRAYAKIIWRLIKPKFEKAFATN